MDLENQSDVLSDILTLIRLRGESIRIETIASGSRLQIGSGSAKFYFVQSGKVTFENGSDDTVTLGHGDLALLPHGDGHVLVATDTSSPPTAEQTLSYVQLPQVAPSLDTDHTQLVCGSFRFDSGPLSTLLSGLPRTIVLRSQEQKTPPWLSAISHFLLEEAGAKSPGSFLMISRLIDLLVIRTLRAWAVSDPSHPGWLKGLSDHRIARALTAMHNEPNREWSVDELARISMMSRSLFAEKFSNIVGDPPLRYLTKWRLTVAADLLRNGGLKVNEVAQRTGYLSEAAFSRAFKANFGYPPSSVQRKRYEEN
ncbi:AraC family transcriptional regulator [Paraburkholderia caledonica]|uniref:AraC-like DNA-binding protein n=1 Tax=Paraburkholderia caledonica TaxID=134536 RepID=A0ABU1KZ22_9BURK|nr:AraC family transcriptional regulator [Paraburkholderia caledonica]MDR6376200.1 AraC-like DNA-binding protein [Paraburkholderia caledonica]